MSFSSGDLKKPEFLQRNPRGRVPAIDDDGFVLYESAAISSTSKSASQTRPRCSQATCATARGSAG